MIKLKDSDVDLYHGNTSVSVAYLGNTQVYPNHYEVPTGLYFEGVSTSYTFVNMMIPDWAVDYLHGTCYSTDEGRTWKHVVWGESMSGWRRSDGVYLRAGSRVYWKNTCDTGGTAIDRPIMQFQNNGGQVLIGGNIMSMVDADNFENMTAIPYDYQFSHLFSNVQGLISAANLQLPADTLTKGCYAYMFAGRQELQEAPTILPATNLADNCYEYMFRYCSSLRTVPSLPATKMAPYCYKNMFDYCTNLRNAMELPATELAEGCYQAMFSAAPALQEPPELPATKLEPYCYEKMFSGCRFANAPALPAMNLAPHCYDRMFTSCYFDEAPALPATKMAEYCYAGMFMHCQFITTPPSLPSTQLAEYCYREMFYGCTKLSVCPTLPATTLLSGCYESMFRNCTSLIKPPSLPATLTATRWTSDDGPYGQMFRGCTSLMYVPAIRATNMAPYTMGYMFDGCASLKVNDKSTSGLTAWRIPYSGTLTTRDMQRYVFKDCYGTRTSDHITFPSAGYVTYYVEYSPIT